MSWELHNPLVFELGEGKVGIASNIPKDKTGDRYLTIEYLTEAAEIGSMVADEGYPSGDVIIVIPTKQTALVLQSRINVIVNSFDGIEDGEVECVPGA